MPTSNDPSILRRPLRTDLTYLVKDRIVHEESVAIKNQINVAAFVSRVFVAACSQLIPRRRSHLVSEAGETVLGSCNIGRLRDGVVAETHGRARTAGKLSWL